MNSAPTSYLATLRSRWYHTLITPLALIAAVILFYMENPWYYPGGGTTERLVATVAFWALTAVVLVLMFIDRRAPEAKTVEVEGPAFARYLFSNTTAGLIWLPIRLFLGFEWLVAGWHKLTGPGWVDGGSALLGYWHNAVKIPSTGTAPITFDWYRSFLQFLIDIQAQTWFGWLITIGEISVGIALLIGALVGIASFFGVVMNMSYLLAGSTSVNPLMFTLAVGLILAWRVAGHYGLDRWLLPYLGVPWKAKVRTGPVLAVAEASTS
jgi:thiosulfate dehydrogenase [quinone] large subunit